MESYESTTKKTVGWSHMSYIPQPNLWGGRLSIIGLFISSLNGHCDSENDLEMNAMRVIGLLVRKSRYCQ